ncbi:MAG: NAD(P)-dependent oxidoreductase [Planctomycetales bacterium]
MGSRHPLNRMSALKDMTVGVVGFGQIGKEVVNRLRPFKCKILVHDPVVPPAAIEQAGGKSVDLNTLYAASDAVTLHCPSLPQTRGMINRDSLSQMKPGAIFLNLARGDLVISDDLVAALQSGHVSAAALDVFNPEPIPVDHPIRKMPNVVIAAHISSASPRAVTTLRETAAQLAAMVLKGEAPRNVVNGVKPT